jgi:hypothetical protein
MTREEPSLETLWLKNTRTMDKVQITDRSNPAPSSKTFSDEITIIFVVKNLVERAHSVEQGLDGKRY